MLISKQLPALYNGVSQQPATVRLPSQCEEMVNFFPTVVDGMRRRPPTEHIATLSTDDLSSAKIHTIDRDAAEQYVVVLTDGNIRVFDLDGNEKTVSMPTRQPFIPSHGYVTAGATVAPSVPNGCLYMVLDDGVTGADEPTWPTEFGETVVSGGVTFQCVPDYLKVDNARQDFAVVTVADFTFIVNRTVFTAMGDETYDTVTPSVDLFSVTDTKKKKGIYAKLRAKIEAETLQAVRAQYHANGLQVFNGTRQSLQDIPVSPAPIDGDVWRIQGTEGASFASYYVRRNGSVWDETVAPNLSNRMIEATLPHALVRLEDGTFEFQPFSWAPRRVGDETTNPNPQFIGRRIRDVFFYKNRLGFLVDEAIVMSRAGDFGNFYRLTVLDQLDDDPISVSASGTSVTKLNYACAFDEGMMAFADKAQFRLVHGEVLKPTPGLDQVTAYNTIGQVRPVSIGSDVYFVSEDGDHCRVWEYYVLQESTKTDATDVTAHCPKYIPSGTHHLAGSSDHDFLVALTTGAPNRAYVYKFYWATETEKAQSAWGYWQFAAGSTVMSAACFGNRVYFVRADSEGVHLERAPLETSAKAPGLSRQIFLDRRCAVEGTWLPETGATEFPLPYDLPEVERAVFRAVRGPDFTGAVGAIISVDPDDYTWVDANSVRIPGNWSAGEVFLGTTFESRYTFSKQFMRNTQDVPIVTGKFILSGYTVYFTETAFFKTEVAPYGVEPDVESYLPSRESEFDGKVLGEEALTIGAPVFTEGAYTFQVYGDAKVATVSLVNDSVYASTFTQAEYSGIYHNNARPV